jgi:hypothetical protein
MMNKKSKKPEQEGDVLGISHATGSIPHTNVPTGGHPQGIEIEPNQGRASASGSTPQRSGATGIDMGAGGEGTDVARKRNR